MKLKTDGGKAFNLSILWIGFFALTLGAATSCGIYYATNKPNETNAAVGNYTTDPTTYYLSIDDTKTGNELLGQLHDLTVDNHRTYTTYEDLKNPNYVFAMEPGDSGKVTDFYTQDPNNLSSSWDGGKVGTRNREHVWCQSLSNGLWGDTGGGADFHHVRPIESTLNSTRNNHPFGVVSDHSDSTKRYAKDTSGQYVNAYLGGYYKNGTDVFEPVDNVKGDVARILMYVYMHYSTYVNVGGTHDDSNNPGFFGNLDITDIVYTSEGTASAAWDLLLSWSSSDSVSDAERVRNNAAATYQGNRNPFIDHPEYAAKIWGSGYNTTVTYTFLDKDWNDATIDYDKCWVGDKSTLNFAENKGPSVTVTESNQGAGAHSLVKFVNVTSVYVNYSTSDANLGNASVTLKNCTESSGTITPGDTTLGTSSISTKSYNVVTSSPVNFVEGQEGYTGYLSFACFNEKVEQSGATFYFKSITVTCSAVINDRIIHVDGVSIDSTDQIQIGAINKKILNYSISPSDASNKNVTWTSSNTEIATVDADGYVTGVSTGEVNITVTTVDGDYSAICTVTVEPLIETLRLNGSTIVPLNDTTSLEAIITPTNSITNPKLSWTSSNTNVATIDSFGVITGISIGVATITCTTLDGSNISASKNIAVSSSSFAYYEKVTTDLSDWSGTFLLVCESASVAFDSRLHTQSKMSDQSAGTYLDVPGNNVSISITNYKVPINDFSTSLSVYISKNNDNTYSIKNQEGAYLRPNSKSTTTAFFSAELTESIEDMHKFTISNSNNSLTLTSVKYTTHSIYYDSGSNHRFRYFSSAKTAISLYKLVSSENGVSLDQSNVTSTISHSIDLTATVSGSGSLQTSFVEQSATASISTTAGTEPNTYIITVTPNQIENITLSVTYGGFETRCLINFTTNVDSVHINKKPSGEKAYGSTYQITATAEGDGTATEGQIVYSSSDQYVATISQSGLITMTGGGQCTITVTYGTATDTCKIKVKENINPITVEAEDEDRTDDYVLVTSADDLVVGGTYIIASSLNDIVMDAPVTSGSSYMSTSYGEKVVVRYTGEESDTKVITNSSLSNTAQIVTLETGSIDGTYCFKTSDNKYIYANNGGMNTGSKDGSGIEERVSQKATIYFTNNYNWETVYIYCYNEGEYSDSDIGKPMTYFGQNEINQGVYTFNLNKGDYDYIRFTAGKSSVKTVEIDVSDVETNNAWYISDSSYNVGTYTFTDFITVYYLNSNDWDGTMQYYYGSGDYNMTFVGYNDQTKAIYYCNLPTSATYVHFYNGSKCSADINLSDVTSTNNMFYATGTVSEGRYVLVGGEYKTHKKVYFTKPSYFNDTIYVKAYKKEQDGTISKYNSNDTYGVYAHYEYQNIYGEKVYSYYYVVGDYNWLYWNDGTNGHKTNDLTLVAIEENTGWYSTTFDVEKQSSGLTVLYYKNTEGWSNVKAHLYGGTATGTTWPGLQMTKIDDTNNIWSIVIRNGDYSTVIFNNDNQEKQSATITIGSNRYWEGYSETALASPYKAIFLTKDSKYPFVISDLKCYAAPNQTDYDEFVCYEHNDFSVFYSHIPVTKDGESINYTRIYFKGSGYSTVIPGSTVYNTEDKLVITSSHGSKWINTTTTIYFTNQWDWSSVKVQFSENADGSGASTPNCNMTWAFNNESGKGVYKLTFNYNENYHYVRFNNGTQYLNAYELTSSPKNGDAWYPEWTYEKGDHALPWTYTGGVDKKQTGYVEKYIVISSRCSWEISISDSGVATIEAAVSDPTTYKNIMRFLQGTGSSADKFTTYLSGEFGNSEDICIYRLVEGTKTATWNITYQDDGEALHFAHEYGSQFEEVCSCVTQGTKGYDDIKELWETMQSDMLVKLTPVSIAMFTFGERNPSGDTIQQYLAKCSYILNKYEDLVESLESSDAATKIFAKDIVPSRTSTSPLENFSNTNITIIIVSCVGVLSISCLGCFYFIRKKKEHENE